MKVVLFESKQVKQEEYWLPKNIIQKIIYV